MGELVVKKNNAVAIFKKVKKLQVEALFFKGMGKLVDEMKAMIDGRIKDIEKQIKKAEGKLPT